jgi:sarcosine oxidase
MAGAIVMAANAWLDRLLPGFPVTVTRQPLFWFEPRARAENFEPTRLPIYIWEPEPDRFFYGFPAFAGQVKVAPHLGGAPSDPDQIDREVHAPEIEAMRARLAAYLPDANGTFVRAAVCMYANTPDHHFIIDRHPEQPRVLVISACSGHGFKFSGAIGEIAADLLLEERTAFDLDLFRMRGWP